MHPRLKIFLSVCLIVLVAFFVARHFIPLAKRALPAKAVSERKVTKKKEPVKTVPAAPVLPRPAEAQMAIILDDWGQSVSRVDTALSIGQPLTLSVIPHLPHSREVAEKAFSGGLGVMLHMPMEPKGRRQPQEPHTIRTTSTDADIVKFIDEALVSVPHAKGMNNHQGSAATSDARVMKIVLTHLKSKDLFFVDSRVVATSVGVRTAKEVGLPYTKRDVFIDNEPTVEAVMKKLKDAEHFALIHGRAVVIGHDKKPTLEAIMRMAPLMEKEGIHFVLVQDLLE